MSNSWSYTLFLNESPIRMQELFERVIALAHEYGYALQFPVYITTNDPPWTLQFWEAKQLTAFICEQGGTVPVWCNGEDIGLDFDVVRRQISLSVLHELRPE